MKRIGMLAGIGLLVISLLMWASPLGAWDDPQEKPAYTRAEWDAYNVAANEKNLELRIKLLDDFMTKYFKSELLPYVYQLYYATYNELKNYPKTIEYVDRLLSIGDKVDVGRRLQALYVRTLAFNFSFSDKDPNAREQATRAREVALEGLKVLAELKKPEGITDEQFAQNKKGPEALFNYTAGYASLGLKDYKTAIDSFKAALAANPNDPVTYFRMGVAYLQMDPPDQMEGFWALARSVALKGPGEAQVRAYLRSRLANYQQTACDKLIDSQMNELITLAGGSAERPANFTIPSAADLQKAREDTASFLADLKAGGDKGKVMFLATCGLEFPDVAVKVLVVEPANDSVVLKVFRAATQEEMEAATEPNMSVKVEGQPETKRIQKNDYVRFTGTLVGYDQNPFMLHWEKAKVNPEDIPEAKEPTKAPAKRPTKRPPKKPS